MRLLHRQSRFRCCFIRSDVTSHVQQFTEEVQHAHASLLSPSIGRSDKIKRHSQYNSKMFSRTVCYKFDSKRSISFSRPLKVHPAAQEEAGRRSGTVPVREETFEGESFS